jgi:hypothetical protein
MTSEPLLLRRALQVAGVDTPALRERAQDGKHHEDDSETCEEFDWTWHVALLDNRSNP